MDEVAATGHEEPFPEIRQGEGCGSEWFGNTEDPAAPCWWGINRKSSWRRRVQRWAYARAEGRVEGREEMEVWKARLCPEGRQDRRSWW